MPGTAIGLSSTTMPTARVCLKGYPGTKKLQMNMKQKITLAIVVASWREPVPSMSQTAVPHAAGAPRQAPSRTPIAADADAIEHTGIRKADALPGRCHPPAEAQALSHLAALNRRQDDSAARRAAGNDPTSS